MMAIPPPKSTSSTRSNLEGATDTPAAGGEPDRIFAAAPIVFSYTLWRAVVVVEGAPV
jgi:hypothetical protein